MLMAMARAAMETANPDFFRNLSLLTHPRLVLPRLRVLSISQIPDALHGLDIRGLILDVDQTVVPYGSTSISDETAAILGRLRADYRCCYASNTPKSSEARQRLQAIERATSIQAISTDNKKPALPVFEAALNYLGTLPEHTAMVGDRLLTDVLGANNAGLLSILVQPIDRMKDPFPIGLIRICERLILSLASALLR